MPVPPHLFEQPELSMLSLPAFSSKRLAHDTPSRATIAPTPGENLPGSRIQRRASSIALTISARLPMRGGGRPERPALVMYRRFPLAGDRTLRDSCRANGPIERRRRNGFELTIHPQTPPAPIGC